jgi:hypothetical protein
MDNAIISGANPIPWRHGGRGRALKRGADRHVRACRPIRCEIMRARTTTRVRQRKKRKECGVFAGRDAVRFQEMKKPAAVAGAGFELLAMMSLCR